MPYFPQPYQSNGPVAQYDALGNLNQSSYGYLAFQGTYVGTNLIYKGLARPGTSTSASNWQIAKLTYDGSNNLLSVTWPQDSNGIASNLFNFVWSDHASYTYS